MLPDLPKLKQDLQRVLDDYLRMAVRKRMHVFADVPRHTVHEGEQMRVYRADGSQEDTGMKETSAEMSMKFSDIPTMTLAERVAQLEELAESMAKQMSEHLFTTLNQSLEKAGQVVDGRGKPLSTETFLETLEKLQVDFDERGEPKGLTIVVAPSLMPHIREMMEEEKNNPEVRKRHDEIMMRKWMEWRDREASRKLVG